jgi:restriction system protein
MNRNNLQESIINIANKIQIIPTSRGYWVNRTDDGILYDKFVEKKIIGLSSNEIPISQLDKIRKNYTLNNGRIGNYNKVQAEIVDIYHNHYARKIRETPKQKRSSVTANITKKANQVFNFVYKMKKGDYVAIPSHNSEYITIGRVSNSYIDNSEYIHLQRTVEWIGTFRKVELDIRIFQVFSSHLAFYDISKHKDVILRTLYDFYFENEDGNFVINLGKNGKISFQEEAKLLYFFNQLFTGYLKSNNLPYSIDDISTIVNLNSKGKRKLFGVPCTTFLAALFMTVALEGDFIKDSDYNDNISTVTKSIKDYIKNVDGAIKGEDLKKAAEEMNVDKQDFFKKILKETSNELNSLKSNRDKINKYY